MMNHFILYSLTLILGAIWILKKPSFTNYTISLITVTSIAFLYPMLMKLDGVSDLKKLLMTGGGFFLLFLSFAYGKLTTEDGRGIQEDQSSLDS